MKKKAPNGGAIFSTSFLDLCCCTLGALIFLMVLLVPQPPPTEQLVDVPRKLNFRFSFPVPIPPFGGWDNRNSVAQPLLSPSSLIAELCLEDEHVPEVRFEIPLLAPLNEKLIHEQPISLGLLRTILTVKKERFCLGLDCQTGPHFFPSPLPPGLEPGHENYLAELHIEIDMTVPISAWPLSLLWRFEVTPAIRRVPRAAIAFWQELDATRGPSTTLAPAANQEWHGRIGVTPEAVQVSRGLVQPVLRWSGKRPLREDTLKVIELRLLNTRFHEIKDSHWPPKGNQIPIWASSEHIDLATLAEKHGMQLAEASPWHAAFRLQDKDFVETLPLEIFFWSHLELQRDSRGGVLPVIRNAEFRSACMCSKENCRFRKAAK